MAYWDYKKKLIFFHHEYLGLTPECVILEILDTNEGDLTFPHIYNHILTPVRNPRQLRSTSSNLVYIPQMKT